MNRSLLMGAGILFVATCLEAQTRFTITNLGTLASDDTEARGINNRGQVVGRSRVIGGGHAYVWENGVMTDLGVLSGSSSIAQEINEAGVAVGESGGRAVVFENGSVRSIGTLGGISQGFSINDAGQAVGRSTLPNGEGRAFLYSNGVMQNLGTFGGSNSSAYDLNSSGVVVGFAWNAAERARAFSYENGALTDLGTLGGRWSIAMGINDLGQIVGNSEIGNREERAFIYEGGVMRNLGTLFGHNLSRAMAINNSGIIVGFSAGTNPHAVFVEGGEMFDLNDLLVNGAGWDRLEVAFDVSDFGQIVGNGIYMGEERAFLLTPIPAPGVVVVLGLACTWRGRRWRPVSSLARSRLTGGFKSAFRAPVSV